MITFLSGQKKHFFHLILLFVICSNPMLAEENNPTETLYVSSQPGPKGDGSYVKPFRNLIEARDYIRASRESGKDIKGGIRIILNEGVYSIPEPIIFTSQDSGDEQSPIVITAEPNSKVILTGGVIVDNFVKPEAEELTGKVKPEVIEHIYCADLKKYGFQSLPPLELSGFGSKRVRDTQRQYKGYKTFPYVELFYNSKPMTLARFPNEGFLQVTEVIEITHESEGTKTIKFKLSECPLDKWTQEKNILLYGYWFYDWADSYESIAEIHPERAEVTLKDPCSYYGYKSGARYYAKNILYELDQPGEWYLDREKLILYFYPPGHLHGALVELSWFEGPMLIFDNAKHIHIERIEFKLCAGNLLQIFDGENIHIRGCTFTQSGGYGVTIDGGKNHKVLSSDFTYLGKGGVHLAGGDRKDLTPSGFRVENCYFSDLARIDRTYNPAVYGLGVGHIISHNFIRNNPSSAFRLDGNDFLVEYNEICDVLTESDDQGALDTWGNPTYRGNIIRYNYWHHIGSWDKPNPHMQASIRLDDAISGVLIFGNIFYKACTINDIFGAIQIHGGKDNRIENNLFLQCNVGITCTPWTPEYWKSFAEQILNTQEIDYELYKQRYPELNELFENINRNTAKNNIFWNCKKIILRQPSTFVFENNTVTEDPNIVRQTNEGLFSLNTDQLKSDQIDFKSIPIEKIGLYTDSYRTKLPTELIYSLRKR